MIVSLINRAAQQNAADFVALPKDIHPDHDR